MNVILAGEMPLVDDLMHFCTNAGHQTRSYLVEDFFDAVHSGYMLGEMSSIDVAIEVHNESAAVKEELLLTLAQTIPETSFILTSALPTSTTHAASWITHPDRVVGFGLLSPLGNENLVEVARGLKSSDLAFNQSVGFWRQLGFRTVKVEDGPGLIRARIVCCLINEAIGALLEGVASARDIDLAMKLGTNYPYGPLEWADLIGLDTVLGVMNGLFKEWGEDRYRPAPLLRRMVQAGFVGKKSGRGFYNYETDDRENRLLC